MVYRLQILYLKGLIYFHRFGRDCSLYSSLLLLPLSLYCCYHHHGKRQYRTKIYCGEKVKIDQHNDKITR